MNRDKFTPEEVAQALGKNVRTIYRHIKDGRLPASKPGTYVITRSDLAKYLGSRDRVEELFGAEAG